MTAFLVSSLLMVASAQAQTIRDCASPHAEVSACPGNYLPKVTVPIVKQSVINAIDRVKLAAAAEKKAYDDLADLKLRRTGDPNEDGDYVKQLQVAQNATKEKYDLANEAIRLVVAVYDLDPPVSDFTGDPRAAANMAAKPWLPRYSQREVPTPPSRGGGGSRPPTGDDQDYIYDPGCDCMIRRR